MTRALAALVGVLLGSLALVAGPTSAAFVDTAASAASIGAQSDNWWNPLELQNGWVPYGGGFASPRVTRSGDGVVAVSGLVKSGNTTELTLLTTLPPHARPAAGLIFQTAANGAWLGGRIDVRTDGSMLLRLGTSADWTSLNGITFLASDAGVTMTDLPLANGWTPYGYWPTAQAGLDPDGRVWIQGLVLTGTTADGDAIALLPAGQRPSALHHLPTALSTGRGTIGISPTAITTNGKVSTWTAIQGMFYAAGAGTWSPVVLENGWTGPTSAADPDAQYTKSAEGLVTLRGLVSGGTQTFDAVLTNLPVGYRPSERIIFGPAANGVTARVDIARNGDVIARWGGVGAGWLALEGMSFIAEG